LNVKKIIINVNVNYLKIPKTRRWPHKPPSRATCGPRVETPVLGSDTSGRRPSPLACAVGFCSEW